MKINIIILLLLVLNCSCSEKNSSIYEKRKHDIADSINRKEKYLNINLEKSIKKNDTLAYAKAFKEFVISDNDKGFLCYAVQMAEKNDYHQAYYDIATILISKNYSYDYSVRMQKKVEGKYELFCLLKAYELGNKPSKKFLEKIYTENGKQIPKSSSIYCYK